MARWMRVTSAPRRAEVQSPYREMWPHGFDRCCPENCQRHARRTEELMRPQDNSTGIAAARQSHKIANPTSGTRVVQHLCFLGEEAFTSEASDQRPVPEQLFPV
jgi:hypothetical protein